MDIKKFFYKYVLRKKYYRYGSCARCGACCTKIYVNSRKSMIKDEEEFKKLQNLHPFYTYLEVIDKDENGLVFKCNKFDADKKICTIHKFRPGICRRYPDEIIFKMGACMSENCGYYFKPIDSFAEVLNNQLKRN